MLDLSIQLNLHGITAFNRYTADRIKVNIGNVEIYIKEAQLF